MFRLTLLVAVTCYTPTAQELPLQSTVNPLHYAEKSAAPSGNLYERYVRAGNWRNAVLAGLQLSEYYRKQPNFTGALYYDSMAVAFARQTFDTILLQKTLASYPLSTLKTRIDSIALVHRLLYSGTAATGEIALHPYFEALSTAVATIFERDKAVKITVDAPIETNSVLAEKLGLIVNELITNSFKYAFIDRENGAIHLYIRQKDNELYLTVADNGGGLPEDAKKGQGSKLIKGLCYQLKGKCSYQNVNGTFFEMTVPM